MRPTDDSSLLSPSLDVAGAFSLRRSLWNRRSLTSLLLSCLAWSLTLVAMAPLFSVLAMLFYRGAGQFRFEMFWLLPPANNVAGGGFGNAILGTVVMVGMAACNSVPIGVLAGIYLAELGRGTRTAGIVRFAARVLTGMPSILTGMFAFALVVLAIGFSAIAGAVALAVLMLPTIVLTAEEALRQVPEKMREAAFGMGATRAQVAWKVVVPAALPGLITGVLLALARAAGETAPLLFTAMFSNFWLNSLTGLTKPTASLSVLIYNFSSVPYENQKAMAWCASLVLVVMVLSVNIVCRVLAPRRQER